MNKNFSCSSSIKISSFFFLTNPKTISHVIFIAQSLERILILQVIIKENLIHIYVFNILLGLGAPVVFVNVDAQKSTPLKL